MNGMTTRKPKVKLAITLSDELARRVREEVARGRAASVSAWIEHAISGQLAAEADFEGLLDEALAATGGPLTEAERLHAVRLLSGSA